MEGLAETPNLYDDVPFRHVVLLMTLYFMTLYFGRYVAGPLGS
jgi:hypothetical protein